MTPTEHVTGTMRAVSATAGAVYAGGWRVWLRGLLVGAVSGGASSVPIVALASCEDARTYLIAVALTFGGGASIGTLMYLVKSPLPWDRKTERRRS